MTAVLYAMPASHPCATVERALELKQVPYRRKDSIPLLHRLEQYARFRVATVPTIRFEDGTKLAGSTAIMKALDERAPEPRLFPTDEETLAGVKRAEEWGDQVLQPLARRIIWAAFRRSPRDVMMSYAEGADLPLPTAVARVNVPLVTWLGFKANHASDPNVRADLAHLDSHLDRADRWVADGAMGGEQANAADLQVGSSIRLLSTLEDLRPRLEGRPVHQLAMRWFPRYPGSVPAGTLPRDWI
jgi:glutathione S-transferase